MSSLKKEYIIKHTFILKILSLNTMTKRVIVGIVVILFTVNFLTGCNSKSKKQIKESISIQDEEIDYETKAEKLFQKMKIKMSDPVSPYKFIVKSINKVEEYTWLVLDDDTTYAKGWERLGYVYSHFHGKQAMLRYDSYMNQGKPDKVEEEEKNAILYFSKAYLYYDKALEFGTSDSANVYFLKSEAASFQRVYDFTIVNLQKAIDMAPDVRKYQANLIEAYLQGGRFEQALEQIEKYKTSFPDSDIPYIYLAGYYYNTGDTLKTIENYKIAVEKGTKPEVAKFLQRYYLQHGDEETADYFRQKVIEAKTIYDPESY